MSRFVNFVGSNVRSGALMHQPRRYLLALVTTPATLTIFAHTVVIPAKAGIQEIQQLQPPLDPRIRGGDGGGGRLRDQGQAA
jgi:hypothetical protein